MSPLQHFTHLPLPLGAAQHPRCPWTSHPLHTSKAAVRPLCPRTTQHTYSQPPVPTPTTDTPAAQQQEISAPQSPLGATKFTRTSDWMPQPFRVVLQSPTQLLPTLASQPTPLRAHPTPIRTSARHAPQRPAAATRSGQKTLKAPPDAVSTTLPRHPQFTEDRSPPTHCTP